MSATQLNDEQQQVYDAAIKGKNVYFDGEAGTGKSFVLAIIAEKLRAKHGEDSVKVTASTGIAAIGVGGSTLHNWAGYGVAECPLASRIKAAARNKNWKETSVLLIEEISMVPAEMFDNIDKIAKSVRRSSKPFGGIQVIICGDFSQLPPITNSVKKFCFQSDCWDKTIDVSVKLLQVFRQSDQAFVDILREVRVAKLSEKTIAVLRSRMVRSVEEVPSKNGIIPTMLYCKRIDVEHQNRRHLEKLPGASKTYTSKDWSDGSLNGNRNLDFLIKNCQAPVKLELKVGAQVMLIKNIDVKGRGLGNGSRGVVTSLEYGFPTVEFYNGEITTLIPEAWESKTSHIVNAKRIQVPLILAWAITTHKSQGMGLDCLAANLEDAFEDGQVYVAMSRATSLEGLHLLSFNPSKIKASKIVMDFYETQKMQISSLPSSSVVTTSSSSNNDGKRQRT